MNSTAMQSVLVAPESHSCEEINELMQSVYSDLNKDVRKVQEFLAIATAEANPQVHLWLLQARMS